MRPSTFNRRRRGRSGYTLIELLLVVALLGLAATLLIPNLVGRDAMRVQAAVRKIIGDLSFAQSDALAHQEYRRVHFYADGRGYAIERVTQATYATPFDPDTADYILDPISSTTGAGGRFITDFSIDTRFEGVVITAVDIDNGESHLVYDPLGGTLRAGELPGAGGTIQLTSGTDVYEISIAPFTGKLSVARVDP